MDLKDKYSINIAEMNCIESDGKNIEQWPHSYLCLVSETQKVFDPEKVSVDNIVQHLHFASDNNRVAEITDEIDLTIRGRFGRTTLFPILGGTSDAIIPVWEHLYAYAEDLVEEGNILFGFNPRFGFHGINCRKLVEAALASVDLELHAEYTKSPAGMGGPKLFSGVPYNHGLLPSSIPLAEATHD